MDRRLIVDGKNLLWRSWDGSLGAAFKSERIVATFFRKLVELREHLGIRDVKIAWEGDTSRNFRLEIFKDYKAHRDEDAVGKLEVCSAIPLTIATGWHCGIDQWCGQEAEGDDAIGYLSTLGPCTIASADRDLLQLVDDAKGIDVIRPPSKFERTFCGSRGEKYDEAAVLTHYGVSAQQLVDYKALVGDVGDGIPGIKGIGPKKGQALISKWGTLDAVLVAADMGMIKSAALTKLLVDKRSDALMSRELARISKHPKHARQAIKDSDFSFSDLERATKIGVRAAWWRAGS